MFPLSARRRNNTPADDKRPIAPRRYGIFQRAMQAVTLAFVLGAALHALPVEASELSGKADSLLTKRASQRLKVGSTGVIVRISVALTAQREAELRSLGCQIYRRLPIIKSVALTAPNRSLNRLAALPYVQRLSADLIVRKTDAFTDTHSMASNAWALYPKLDPTHVLVGVVDSGINKVNDVQNVVKSLSFIANNANLGDECGHGTHVAGIISGSGASSTGTGFTPIRGVGYNASSLKAPLLASLKALGADGTGRVSDVVAAMQWLLLVAKHDKSAGVTLPPDVRVVLNLSIGHPVAESYTTDPLCQACEALWQAGAVVVCSAGNDGRLQDTVDPTLDNEGYGTSYGTINSPGNDPYVITVGAVKNMDGNRADDRLSTYSSRGPTRLDLVLKPDIIAPGNKVVSVDAGINSASKLYSWLRGAYPGNLVPQSEYYSGTKTLTPAYYKLSGTSMAAPVVSAAVAMMLAQNMTLTPDTIKARLMLTADKWNLPNGSAAPCSLGAGYVNVLAAMSSSVVATQSALSPNMVQDAQGSVYISIDRAIWGTGVTDLRAIWGTKAIWGTTTNLLSASKAIWGTGVWSDRAVWGVDIFGADFSKAVIGGE